MPVTIPPPPYKTPFVDRSGTLAPAWQTWFRDLFIRIGGKIALTNVELAEVQSENLEAIQDDIDALEASVTTLQGTSTSQGNAITILQATVEGILLEPCP
jgi:hypothetical protein